MKRCPSSAPTRHTGRRRRSVPVEGAVDQGVNWPDSAKSRRYSASDTYIPRSEKRPAGREGALADGIEHQVELFAVLCQTGRGDVRAPKRVAAWARWWSSTGS